MKTIDPLDFSDFAFDTPEFDTTKTELVVRFLSVRREMPQESDDLLWMIFEGESEVATGLYRDIACVGVVARGALHAGQFYRLYGKFDEYKNPHNGKASTQFRFTSYCDEMPADREGMIALLTRCGSEAGVGIGKRRCIALYDVYGDKVFDVIVETPERALETLARKKMVHTEEQFAEFSRQVDKHRAMAKVKGDVLGLLKGRGFQMKSIEEFVKKYGALSAGLIRKNPHLLLTVGGFGISRVDQLYLDLGGNPTKPKRVALAVKKLLQDDNSGSVWHPEEDVKSAVSQAIKYELKSANVEKAMKIAKRKGIVSEARTLGGGGVMSDRGNVIWVADKEDADLEREIAGLVASSEKQWNVLERVDYQRFGCSEQQEREIRRSFFGSVGIFCGGPGTGKTFCLSAVVLACVSMQKRVIIGAPTGMARKRINDAIVDAMISHGINGRPHVHIGTWHSLGAGGGKSTWEGTDEFDSGTLILGDESSMNDLSQCAAILRKFKGCQIVFAGDPDQLPPVGRGSPFCDLINSGVIPVGRLTKVERNKGGAVVACHAIRQNKPWTWGDNFMLLDAKGPDEISQGVLSQMNAAMLAGLNPIHDVQVVCAVNEGHAAAKYELNLLLQSVLNSEGEPVGKTRFRIGDKVINRKNCDFETFAALGNAGKIRVNNGEGGVIVDAGSSRVSVRLSDDNLVDVPMIAFEKTVSGKRSAKTDDDNSADEESKSARYKWELGYAISVHASQGSEWQRVIVVLDPTPKAQRLCGKEWFTTGTTRHKDLCVCVGTDETAKRMTARSCVRGRKGFLMELLRAESAKLKMEDM